MPVPIKHRQFSDTLEADLHTCREPGPVTPVHAHDFVEIGFVTHGRAQHHLGTDRESPILAGDLFVIDPFRPHHYTRPRQLEVCYLLIGPTTFRETWNDACGLPAHSPAEPVRSISFPAMHPVGPQAREVKSLLLRIQDELTRQSWGYPLMVKALLVELFVVVHRWAARAGGSALCAQPGNLHEPRIQAVLDFMDRHYTDDLRLADLARRACLHPQYLCRVFKRRLGMSLIDYLTRLRIRRASELLDQTTDPVTEICYRSGFRDLSHFIRTFRKITGNSPREFRKKSH